MNEITDNFKQLESTWLEVCWSVLFLIISLIGATGNVIVVWIVLAHKKMRTVTNLYIVNLAFADGLVAALCSSRVGYQLIYDDWIFGLTYCRITEGVSGINTCVSVLMLSMISIDRYMAVMYPFKARMKKLTTITIIVAVWLISIALSYPHWIYNSVVFDEETLLRSCIDVWPSKELEEMYGIVFVIVTYFIPLICLTYCYSRMAIKLWGSKAVGVQLANNLKKEVAKKKIVKMMIVVVTIFAGCWLPFQIIGILTAFNLIAFNSVFCQEILKAALWLGLSNSMYNPIIYCWMNGKYRAGFKRVLRCCPFVKHDSAQYSVHFSNNMRQSSYTETE